jgi:ubiquinone/menaquinone biosynthesis C-methylase UbiE
MERSIEQRSEHSKTFLDAPEIHVQWASDYLNADLDAFYDACYARIVEKLAPAPGARILDAGCGYGHHAVRLASHGLRVTGLDFSQAALARARDNIGQAGMAHRIDLRQGDLLAMPFGDAAFGYVNCWGVLMHIPDLERALVELARVLRPGGKLVLTENNARSWDVRFVEPAIRLTKRTLRRPLKERVSTHRGIEEWAEAAYGGLMVRKTDLAYLERFCQMQGLTLVDRYACQFTEIYTNVPTRLLKRQVHAFNARWFRRGGDPRLALGNTLIFEKR